MAERQLPKLKRHFNRDSKTPMIAAKTSYFTGLLVVLGLCFSSKIQ
jgi:hypothetical protein